MLSFSIFIKALQIIFLTRCLALPWYSLLFCYIWLDSGLNMEYVEQLKLIYFYFLFENYLEDN